jgi:HlyD family secretion protein
MGGGGGDFMLVLVTLAKPGSRVKKGDIVAEFDRQYQLLRLDDYRAQVVQRDANIKKLKADQAVYRESHNQLVKVAKAELEKARLDMKTEPVRSAIDAEWLRLALEEAEAHYKQILAEVKLVEEQLRAQLRANEIDRDQAAIELRRAENNIDRMVLRAPLDGIVVMQSTFRGGEFGQVQEGDMLRPGQLFMQIVDPDSMVLDALVNQADSESLRIGMKAKARLDAYPDLALESRVHGIGAITKPGMWRPNYMREIPVKLKLEEMDPRVIPDLSANADVFLHSEKQAVVAPLASVFRDAANSRPFVFLRTPGGFERREVELGLRNNVAVAVRSGLKEGQVIAAQRPPMGERK